MTGYYVYRSTTSGGESLVSPLNNSPITTTTYFDNTCLPGATYYYEVVAVNSVGFNSIFSNEASAVTASTGLLATDDQQNPNTQIDLSWGAANGPVTSYNVYCGTSPYAR